MLSDIKVIIEFMKTLSIGEIRKDVMVGRKL
jgi:hypothetical protein